MITFVINMQLKPDVATTDSTPKHVQGRSSQTPKGTGITPQIDTVNHPYTVIHCTKTIPLDTVLKLAGCSKTTYT